MKKLLVMAVVLGGAAVASVQAADVKENWKAHCAKCHGDDGKGQTKMGQKAGCKDLTDAKVQDELKDDKAFKAVKEGMKDGDKTVMKAYNEVLSDDEIKALVAHVRTFKK
jgi:cytochrome c553